MIIKRNAFCANRAALVTPLHTHTHACARAHTKNGHSATYHTIHLPCSPVRCSCEACDLSWLMIGMSVYCSAAALWMYFAAYTMDEMWLLSVADLSLRSFPKEQCVCLAWVCIDKLFDWNGLVDPGGSAKHAKGLWPGIRTFKKIEVGFDHVCVTKSMMAFGPLWAWTRVRRQGSLNKMRDMREKTKVDH